MPSCCRGLCGDKRFQAQYDTKPITDRQGHRYTHAACFTCGILVYPGQAPMSRCPCCHQLFRCRVHGCAGTYGLSGPYKKKKEKELLQ